MTIMKTQFVFYFLLIMSASACKKPVETSEVCMINLSGHPVHFWTSGHKGILTNFYDDLCGYEVEQGGYFYWKADYPTINPNSGSRTGYLMVWQCGFTVENEDFNFKFTDQSGTLIYDFRDSKVGYYMFDCKLVESLPFNQSNLIWADTLMGTISKNSFLNQLNIEIDTFYTGTAVFDAYDFSFKFSDGAIGTITTINQNEIMIETSYFSNGQSLNKICHGKKF